MIPILILLIMLLLCKNDIIEHFDSNIYTKDDVKFIPVNDGKNNNLMQNNYYLQLRKNHIINDGIISNMNDYMGLESHNYLFELQYILVDYSLYKKAHP